MSQAVDISAQLRNGDDSAFGTGEAVAGTEHVLVSAPQYITAEQLQQAGMLKTTHIVIHDQSHSESVDEGPASPLSPSDSQCDTPARPGSYKYSWDESAHDAVLPVRCKHTNGQLQKNKFGSGGRGRCIKSGANWYTPSEFEAACGRASSKDWKRSIRYGGRTLHNLIEDGILQPHAASCTCAACCDDVSVTGPVRLFVPYKRRKISKSDGETSPTGKLVRPGTPGKNVAIPTSAGKETVVVTLTPTSSGMSCTETVQIIATQDGETYRAVGNRDGTQQTIQIISDGQSLDGSGDGSQHVIQVPGNAAKFELTQQKIWWQLDELTNNVLSQAQQLKHVVEQFKQQSNAMQEAAFEELKQHLQQEKQDALNAARIEAQMNLSRTVIEARAEKEIAVQHALAQARAEMTEQNPLIGNESGVKLVSHCANCDREALSECTGCRRVSYCCDFCQRKDWINHQNVCGQDDDAAAELLEHDGSKTSEDTD